MPTAKINNINIYYEEQGQGFPLVLIAGLGSDHFFWSTIKNKLAKDYRLILLDNRGVGQSDAPDEPYSTEQMADDTKLLLDYLEIDQCYLMGHSMGGMIAQQMAIKCPTLIKKLIIYASFAAIPKRSLWPMQFNIELLNRGVEVELACRNAIMFLCGNRFLADEKRIKDAIDLMLNNPYPQSLATFANQLNACMEHDTTQQLTKISAPTLVLAGEEDLLLTKTCTEQLTKGIPQVKLVTVPLVGHRIHIEDEANFLKAFTEFMDSNNSVIPVQERI